MIRYKWSQPRLPEYKNLIEIVGWTSIISVSDKKFRTAIDNSWQWASAFDNSKLVGIGRLISDGALYALVADMIVHPEYQKRGIGSSILKMLKAKCADHDIQRVWLFSARGQTHFYRDNGFEPRLQDAPGMQLPI